MTNREVPNSESSSHYRLAKCSREQFVAAITDDPGDKFAKTFVAKADTQKQWDDCVGYFEDGVLMGAIITTVSKREPKIANLQLLHTFAAYRGKGIGHTLTLYSLFKAAILNGADYFRVSAEPDAVGFYEKLGFKFWGKQKSGCSLSMFKINPTGVPKFSEGIYDENDPVIRAALYSGRKGSLASSYREKATLDAAFD